MLNLVRNLALASFFLVATVTLGLITRDSAPSFQQCQNAQYKTDGAPAQQPERFSIFVEKFFAPLCTARFLEAHNAVITAIATVLLTFVTGGLVWAGYQQIRTTRAQLRAYLSIATGEGFRQGAVKGLKFEFRPVVINTGQTPAYKVNISGALLFLETTTAADFDWDGNIPAPTGAGVLTLGTQQNRFTKGILDRTLNKAELRQFRKGTHSLYVFGKVTYLVAFQRQRYTNYCFLIGAWNKRGPATWITTFRHNDSD